MESGVLTLPARTNSWEIPPIRRRSVSPGSYPQASIIRFPSQIMSQAPAVFFAVVRVIRFRLSASSSSSPADKRCTDAISVCPSARIRTSFASRTDAFLMPGSSSRASSCTEEIPETSAKTSASAFFS